MTVPESGEGFLEISDKGFGFLRSPANRFQSKPTDIFVTPDMIKRNYLREGVQVEGSLRPPHKGNSPQLKEIKSINGMAHEEYVQKSPQTNGKI